MDTPVVKEPTEAPTGQRWCICNIKIGKPGRGQRPPNTRRSKTVVANNHSSRLSFTLLITWTPQTPRPSPPKSVRGPTEVQRGVSVTSISIIRCGAASIGAPPPGSWGRTLLLIRVANPSPQISRRFPCDDAPSAPG